MNAEISAACSTLRGVDNALSPMRDAVAALGPLLTNKADETSTQLSRIESSIVSSMLVHQAMVANAVSIADQRNAAYERNFDVGKLHICHPGTQLILCFIVSAGDGSSTSYLSTQRFEESQRRISTQSICNSREKHIHH